MAKLILPRIGIVLIVAVLVALGRGVFFYRGLYSPPPTEVTSYVNFTVPPAPTTEFTDNYTQGEGIILIDRAHKNGFQENELNVLLLRLVSRGLTIKYLEDGDDLKKELLGKAEEPAKIEETPDKEDEDMKPRPKEKVGKEEKPEEVKPANAFIVISPQSQFSKEEIEATDNFTRRGGKLLLIADPTRSRQINSLAIRFGVLFEPDYLYNMKENEINYRNIFISDFKENGITKGLKKVALYTAGSVSSANGSIAFIDENTFSSVLESRKRMAPLALTRNSQVLAVHDFTFMTEPYNGTLDNNQLVANIADWLIPAAKEPETK